MWRLMHHGQAGLLLGASGVFGYKASPPGASSVKGAGNRHAGSSRPHSSPTHAQLRFPGGVPDAADDTDRGSGGQHHEERFE